jgi:hypothetical protein
MFDNSDDSFKNFLFLGQTDSLPRKNEVKIITTRIAISTIAPYGVTFFCF